MEEITLKTVLQIFSGTAGTLGVLTLVLVLLYKGELLPRKVWQELTMSIIDALSQRLIEVMKEMMKVVVKEAVREAVAEAIMEVKDAV